MLAEKSDAEKWSKVQYLIAGLIILMHFYFFSAALIQKSYLTDDSIQYLRLAENWVENGSFSQSFFPPFVEDTQRTPGYPAFLILCLQNPVLILMVQHLMVFGAGFLIFRIVKRIHNAKLGRRIAFFYLLQPYPAIFASMILSETLFIFLFLLSFLFFLKFWDSKEKIAIVYSFAALAFATHVRPVAFPLLILAMLLAIWKLIQSPKRWMEIAVGILIPFLIIGSWMFRNEQLTGRWMLSSMGEMGMLHGRVGGLEAMRQGLGVQEHVLYMAGDSIAATQIGLRALRSYPKGKETHETELLAKGMAGFAIKQFASHPLDALRFQFLSVLEMLKGIGYGWAKLLTKSSVIASISATIQAILNFFMYLGMLAALFRLKAWRFPEILSIGIIVLVLLVSAAAWADGRYRVVIDPFFLILLSFVLWNFENLQIRSKENALN